MRNCIKKMILVTLLVGCVVACESPIQVEKIKEQIVLDDSATVRFEERNIQARSKFADEYGYFASELWVSQANGEFEIVALLERWDFDGNGVMEQIRVRDLNGDGDYSFFDFDGDGVIDNRAELVRILRVQKKKSKLAN